MNPTPEEPSNIVALNASISSELELQKTHAAQAVKCYSIHRHVEVDVPTRTITCKACGFVVDPFDYLAQWATEGERRMEGLKRIEILRKIAQAEHDNLMKKVANLRAKLKRDGEPQPIVEREEFRRQRWNI